MSNLNGRFSSFKRLFTAVVHGSCSSDEKPIDLAVNERGKNGIHTNTQNIDICFENQRTQPTIRCSSDFLFVCLPVPRACLSN